MPKSAIAARNLGFSWPGGAPALAGISLEVAAGEKLALLGANGAGKTTFLRLLAGRLEKTAGELEIFGEKDPRKARGRLAYLPQELTLDPEMTAGETLSLIAALLGLPDRKHRIEAAAAVFGLGPYAGKKVSELSGGWRRRLDLALFFLEDRKLLLLDEPGAGLDAAGEEILFAELESRSAQGAAVLISGHDQVRLAAFARRAVLFEAGAIVGEGAPETLAWERQDPVHRRRSDVGAGPRARPDQGGHGGPPLHQGSASARFHDRVAK